VITSLIVAASDNDVIARSGALPWYLPEDLRHFRELTTGHPVVLGRVTHESILTRLGHPLEKRTSVVVSRTQGICGDERVVWKGSLEAALSEARRIETLGANSQLFVIGGASIYRQALPVIDKIYLTRLHHFVEGDRHLPGGWLSDFQLISQEDRSAAESGLRYSFLEYLREPQ
jgi:dihydrofolate reductase